MKRLVAILLFTLSAFMAAVPAAAAADDNLAALKEKYLSADQYYYKQLSSEHKEAWDFVTANVLNYPKQAPSGTRNPKYQALAPMIKSDNPRIFWIDWIDSYGRLRFDVAADVSAAYAPVWPGDKDLPALQSAFYDAISDDVNEIKTGLSESANKFETVKAITDWLCDNNTYNEAQTSSHKKDSEPVAFAYLAAHSAYSAIVKGDEFEPVCEGYAAAFKILCEEFGVECICVSGSASFASAHMWNYVKLDDGNWYQVDVTSIDNDHKNSSGAYADYNYKFFLGGAVLTERRYTPNPYLGSGINPDHGYDTDGAAFSFPSVTDNGYAHYLEPPQIISTDVYGGKRVTITGRNLSVNTSNLYLYYTADGTDPTEESESVYRYYEPMYGNTVEKELWLFDAAAVKAKLRAGGDTWANKSFSAAAVEEITVEQADAPATAADGSTVTITPPASAGADVRIYYTTDGTVPSYAAGQTPSITGTLYSEEFTASEGQIIQAIAVDKGCSVSEPASYTMTHIHSFSADWTVSASHHWHICSGCNEISDKAEHRWDEGKETLPPACTAEGVKTFTCSVCQETKTEAIPATGHRFSGAWSGDDANHWHVCENCSETSAAAAHTFNNGVITTQPTYDNAGEKTYTCTACGYTRSEKLAALSGYTIQLLRSTSSATELSLTNQTGSETPVRFIAAVYDQNGKMIAVKMADQTLPASGSLELAVSYAPESNARTMKAFVLSPGTSAPLRGGWSRQVPG